MKELENGKKKLRDHRRQYKSDHPGKCEILSDPVDCRLIGFHKYFESPSFLVSAAPPFRARYSRCFIINDGVTP